MLLSAFLFKGTAAKVFDYCISFNECFYSEWILNEFETKLSKKFNIIPSDIEAIRAIIKSQFKLVYPLGDAPIICRDKDDNNILHAAISAKANYIITGDKDLLILKELSGLISLHKTSPGAGMRTTPLKW